MKPLFISLCFVFTLITFYSPVSYGDFSYDIDRFTMVGGISGSDTFVDEFDDGAEPPSGPSGPFTYEVNGATFSPAAESGGLLNLNSNDAPVQVDLEREVNVVLNDNTFSVFPGVGGSIQGKFRFGSKDSITEESAFGIELVSEGGITAPEEEVFLEIRNIRPLGYIAAVFEIDGVISDINIMDVSADLTGITEIILRMDISTTNEVTASLFFDKDSNGSFETEVNVPGSYVLTFMSGIVSYKGKFDSSEDLAPYSDIRMSQEVYTSGDTATASVFRIGNPGPNPISVEWKVWLGTPFTSPIPIVNIGADGMFVLPAGFDLDLGPLNLFPAAVLPLGIYELSTRVLNPVTGELLYEDLNAFEIQ
ncbi:MAG: hypothetical protein K8F52_18180 [Candidatus Scalindua rubra]|uniref:Uncharacterized protein n=1 Tax=Candidatus Scalindua brodae TaxID=237368 RepID=A0A0B0EJX3_9BACT|nr:MAG: hypothetical protein SCABRO_02821 [Candidatus Scalindua brodae]MBZ0110584.1 hypothetical protein [Candidatus Scalindua rubra]TWU35387.1 hypothetical protein S225a_07450 [Candidatus Brocadiaceae bacterium S225]